MSDEITYHALRQYCQRVEPITLDKLTAMLKAQLPHPQRRNGDLILLGGVWWVYVNSTFVSCYGRSHLDLPKALGWAARNNDKIVLGDCHGD